MADPIVLTHSRKRQLRLAFREIQAEQGGGVVVAFANARAPHVQQALKGLAETGSITEPRYTNDGYAVVKTVTPEDNAAETAPAPPTGDELEAAKAAEGRMATQQGDPDEPLVSRLVEQPVSAWPESPDTAPELKAPPTSGPGSGTDAWREYAITATGLPAGTFDGMDRAQIIEQLRLKGLLGG